MTHAQSRRTQYEALPYPGLGDDPVPQARGLAPEGLQPRPSPRASHRSPTGCSPARDITQVDAADSEVQPRWSWGAGGCSSSGQLLPLAFFFFSIGA